MPFNPFQKNKELESQFKELANQGEQQDSSTNPMDNLNRIQNFLSRLPRRAVNALPDRAPFKRVIDIKPEEEDIPVKDSAQPKEEQGFFKNLVGRLGEFFVPKEKVTPEEEQPELQFTPKDPSLTKDGKSVDTIVDKPIEFEARALKNNNPTNVRVKGEKDNFFKFDSVEDGIRGGFSDLVNKMEGKGEITNEILAKHNIKEPTIGDLMLIHVIGEIDYNNEEGKKYLKDLKDNTGIPHWKPVKDFPQELRPLLYKGMMRNESIVFFKQHRNLVDELL